MDLRERIEKNKKYLTGENPPLPNKNMLIELNNICNHECIFCANRKMSRPKGFMKLDLLDKILRDAYANGVREVGYYTTGEPFINPNLDKCIKMAKDIGYEYIYLTTNGALATIDKVKKCVEAGLSSIKFSINAYDRKTYEFTHGKDDFDTVINNLKQLSDYKKENHLEFKIYVSSIVTKYTVKSKELLNDIFEKQNIIINDIVFFNVENQTGLLTDIIDDLYVENHKRRVQCGNPFTTINITHEGYLTICCADFENNLVVADLNKMTLTEAWNCDEFINIRKKFLENKLENTMCYNCLNNKTDEFTPLIKKFGTAINFQDYYMDKELEKRKK